MTECTNIDMQDLLPEFIADALPARDREQVELHLATCAACQADHALLVAVRHARPVPSPVNIAAIVAALPRPFAVGVSEHDQSNAANGKANSSRPSLTVERGGQSSRHVSPPSVAAVDARSRSRSRMAGTAMRYAAAFTIVAVGGLSMVMARRTPSSLPAVAEAPAVFSNEAPMELAIVDRPYAPDRVPVRAVVSVAPAVLPIQELSDYSDEELTLLMQQLDDWDGAPPVDSVRLLPSGNDSVIQGSS